MLGGLDAVVRECVLHVTIRRNGLVVAIADLAALELIDVLANEVTLDAISSDVCQRLLNDFEFPKARKLLQHQQQSMFVMNHGTAIFEFHFV